MSPEEKRLTEELRTARFHLTDMEERYNKYLNGYIRERDAHAVTKEKLEATKRDPGFPVMYNKKDAPGPMRIPRSVAEKAYSVYSAQYGRGQSLDRLGERGGFGAGELDMFVPGWREECSEVEALRKRAGELETALKRTVGALDIANSMLKGTWPGTALAVEEEAIVATKVLNGEEL